MPPNNVPAMYRVEQALKTVPKGLEIILMGDLNVRLRDPRDKLESLADRGMVIMIDQFMPQRQSMGSGIWTCIMQR